jgi:hypothetical protein
MSYHYLIDDDGTIVKAVPVGRTALHAAGANRGSIGIAFTGGTNASWSPTVEQWASAKALIANLVKDYRSIHYLVGHGDVRDTNAGEPYNVSFDRMIAELQSESHVALRHPTSDEPPLEAFRRAAVYLLEHPRVPRRVTRPEALRKFETLTCSEGKVRRVPVTLNGIP